MAQKDYIADPGSGEVHFKGATVALYDVDKKVLKEYVNDGENRKRWIALAIKNAPDTSDGKFDIESDNAFEIAIAIAENEEDFYVHFPAAPRPKFNPVGHLHEDIFRWIETKYPSILSYLYPSGYWSAEQAGLGKNRTIRPLDEIKIDYLN